MHDTALRILATHRHYLASRAAENTENKVDSDNRQALLSLQIPIPYLTIWRGDGT